MVAGRGLVSTCAPASGQKGRAMMITRARGWCRRRAAASAVLLLAAVALTLAAPVARAQERDPFAPVTTTVAPDTGTVSVEGTTLPDTASTAPSSTAATAPSTTAPTVTTVPGPPPGGLAFSGPANAGLLVFGACFLLGGLALIELFRPRLIRRG